MSLARALTTRMRNHFEDSSSHGPSRAFSTRGGGKPEKPFDRKLISLPVELISCSNTLAFEAPDIGKITANMHGGSADNSQPNSPTPDAVMSPISSASSTKSWADDLASPALTSASSVTSHEDSRESSPANLDPNPMSSFFLEKDQKDLAAKKASRETKLSFTSRQSTATTATTATTASTNAMSESESVPAVPKRSLTHTKQSHQVLARQRSISRLSNAREAAAEAVRTSTERQLSALKLDLEHPFGAELEKVNELVEELKTSGGDVPEVQILDEETQALIDEGFSRFTAADYIVEIQPLFCKAFGDSSLPIIQEWI